MAEMNRERPDQAFGTNTIVSRACANRKCHWVPTPGDLSGWRSYRLCTSSHFRQALRHLTSRPTATYPRNRCLYGPPRRGQQSRTRILRQHDSATGNRSTPHCAVHRWSSSMNPPSAYKIEDRSQCRLETSSWAHVKK
jgi:hypothetical protein